MSKLLVPDARSIRDLLSMMYGDSVPVREGEKSPDENWHAATYINDDGTLAAVCACDAAFVVYSGAAMTLIPAPVAQEMLDEKNCSEVILDNFHEIMNICSRLLMSDTTPHVRLEKTLQPGPSEAAFSTLAPEATLAAFTVDFPRYGTGSLVFHLS